MDEKQLIYLDFAATKPLMQEVNGVMAPFWVDNFGNPSSVHSYGRKAKAALDQARYQISQIMNCQEDEIFFTSGGTESDNLAIKGTVKKFFQETGKIPHIITSSAEHPAVYNTCKELEASRQAEVTFIDVGKNGTLSWDNIKKNIKDNTLLVSVIYVNNEIGTISPIDNIGLMLADLNKTRENKIYFHTDAVQAAPYFDMDVTKLNVDLLSISGHKLGGPKGIGTLFIKKDVKLSGILKGGSQELGLRPGTENVPGIVGISKAFDLSMKNRLANIKKIENIKVLLEKGLKRLGGIIVGENSLRSPAIVSVIFPNIDADTMVINLDLEGICVSSGAACSSGSVEKSRTLQMMEIKEAQFGAVRFSLDETVKENDINKTIASISKVISLSEDKR